MFSGRPGTSPVSSRQLFVSSAAQLEANCCGGVPPAAQGYARDIVVVDDELAALSALTAYQRADCVPGGTDDAEFARCLRLRHGQRRPARLLRGGEQLACAGVGFAAEPPRVHLGDGQARRAGGRLRAQVGSVFDTPWLPAPSAAARPRPGTWGGVGCGGAPSAARRSLSLVRPRTMPSCRAWRHRPGRPASV